MNVFCILGIVSIILGLLLMLGLITIIVFQTKKIRGIESQQDKLLSEFNSLAYNYQLAKRDRDKYRTVSQGYETIIPEMSKENAELQRELDNLEDINKTET
jgi:hypothetical protein